MPVSIRPHSTKSRLLLGNQAIDLLYCRRHHPRPQSLEDSESLHLERQNVQHSQLTHPSWLAMEHCGAKISKLFEKPNYSLIFLAAYPYYNSFLYKQSGY